MEEFMQREENYVFTGYGNSPKPDDMDFNDVFGGPPRRFSTQEVSVRYSFGKTSEEPEEEKASITEKPVFGEETGSRRRHQGGNFFDDIFRGSSESYNSSPRRSDSYVFGSSPGSRAMSPAKPLTPKVEPFGTSLPTQFSLPAKLKKAIEFPAFGSNNHGHQNMGPSTNQSIKGQDKLRNELHQQSPLSRQPSLSGQGSPITSMSDKKDDTSNSGKGSSKNTDSFDNKFHFSIYKWAGQGVPMLSLPLMSDNLKSKRNKNNHENKTSFVVKQGSSFNIERENEAVYEIPELRSRSSSNDVNVVHETVHLKREKSLKKETKPLRDLLGDEDEQPENVPETKEIKTRNPKGVNVNARDSKNAKKNGRKFDSKSQTVEKSILQDEAVSSGVISRKSLAKGVVKEFVQIFNQEVDSRPKPELQRRNQSSKWKNLGVDHNKNKVSSNKVAKDEEKLNLGNEDKKSDVTVKVDANQNNDEPQQHSNYPVSTNLKKTFSSETIHRDSKISMEIFDDPLDFVVQVLSDDHQDLVTQDENSEDMKSIDAKIRQWSVGKKGNIRSLLSTLQYVLWTGSGWKPVPLVDLIETNAVKRAYQKALLRLHPDKLQQKGADVHHKYIAEKVFNILQEAWDHFNTCSSLDL